MAEIKIHHVQSASDLRRFIGFPYKLYKGNPYWCPQFRFDEKRTLSKDKNPAFEYLEAEYWLAYKNGKPAGRIAGIYNPRANERWNEKLIRFGWIDFIEDFEVARALLTTVEEWGKTKGMTGIHGPLGFTDMDNEGMLISGFDELSTMASTYNYPYYPEFLERMGFTKAADWLQFEFGIPPEVPEKIVQFSKMVSERYGLRVLKAKKAKEFLPYAMDMFRSLNAAFHDLYGFVSLTEKQMQNYVKQYFGFIRPEFISIVLDKDDKVTGFGVSLPSLTRALQKCNGRLFPFGFIHILKAMKKPERIDMYLNGVRPDYQNKGVHAMYYEAMHRAYIDHGIKLACTNPQLEENSAALNVWKNFEGRNHIRRRCYVRHFNS